MPTGRRAGHAARDPTSASPPAAVRRTCRRTPRFARLARGARRRPRRRPAPPAAVAHRRRADRGRTARAAPATSLPHGSPRAGAGYRLSVPPVAILDVDGTLVETNYHHAIAWYRAFTQNGVELPVWRIHRAIGMGGDQLVAALAGDDVENEKGDDIRDAEKVLYMAMIHEVRPLPGARR